MSAETEIAALVAAVAAIPKFRAGGFVTGCTGGLVAASGLTGRAAVGDVCLIERRGMSASPLFDERDAILAEVV